MPDPDPLLPLPLFPPPIIGWNGRRSRIRLVRAAAFSFFARFPISWPGARGDLNKRLEITAFPPSFFSSLSQCLCENPSPSPVPECSGPSFSVRSFFFCPHEKELRRRFQPMMWPFLFPPPFLYFLFALLAARSPPRPARSALPPFFCFAGECDWRTAKRPPKHSDLLGVPLSSLSFPPFFPAYQRYDEVRGNPPKSPAFFFLHSSTFHVAHEKDRVADPFPFPLLFPPTIRPRLAKSTVDDGPLFSLLVPLPPPGTSREQRPITISFSFFFFFVR